MVTSIRVVWAPLVCALLACNVAPPKNVGDGGPTPSRKGNDWRRSVTWLRATTGAPSGAAAECAHIRDLILAEKSCRGRLCGPAKELEAEWQDKCGAEEAGDALAEARAHFEDQLDEIPTPCFADYRALTEEECEGEACYERAQLWATRCAHTEGGELSLGIVKSIVRRALGADGRPLDPRSCADLANELAQGARCDDEADCRAAMGAVELYDERCSQPGKPPSLTVALQRAAIVAGAGQAPSAVSIESGTSVSPDELPLVLADRQGAILTVCGRRVASTDEYLATRERCGGGPVTFGMLRAGRLTVTTLKPVGEWAIIEAYPRFALIEERAAATKAAAEGFAQALDEALSSPSTLGAILHVIDRHALDLGRSVALQQELTARDEKIRPVLRQLAEAKVAFAKRFTTTVEQQRGLWQRGRERPLADVSLEGTIAPLAATTASLLDLTTWLPEATAAYTAALAPLAEVVAEANEKQRRRARWGGATSTEEASSAVVAANKVCLQAREAFNEAQRSLDDCAFTGCDDTRFQQHLSAREKARATAVTSQHRYDEAAAMTETPAGPFMCDPLF